MSLKEKKELSKNIAIINGVLFDLECVKGKETDITINPDSDNQVSFGLSKDLTKEFIEDIKISLNAKLNRLESEYAELMDV